APGNREELPAHPQKATRGNHRIGDSSAGDVEHDRLDLAQVFARQVDDAFATQCRRVHYVREWSIRCPWADIDDLRSAATVRCLRPGEVCLGDHECSYRKSDVRAGFESSTCDAERRSNVLGPGLPAPAATRCKGSRRIRARAHRTVCSLAYEPTRP